MHIDPLVTPLDNLYALLNQANGLTLTSDEISLSFSAMTESEGGFNTVLKAEATPAFRYTGSVNLRYRRLRLDELVTGLATITATPLSTLDSVKQDLCTAYGLWPAAVTLEGELPIGKPATNGDIIQLTLRVIDPEHPVYLLSEIVHDVLWSEPHLSTLLSNLELPDWLVSNRRETGMQYGTTY